MSRHWDIMDAHFDDLWMFGCQFVLRTKEACKAASETVSLALQNDLQIQFVPSSEPLMRGGYKYKNAVHAVFGEEMNFDTYKHQVCVINVLHPTSKFNLYNLKKFLHDFRNHGAARCKQGPAAPRAEFSRIQVPPPPPPQQDSGTPPSSSTN